MKLHGIDADWLDDLIDQALDYWDSVSHLSEKERLLQCHTYIHPDADKVEPERRARFSDTVAEMKRERRLP